jgi:MFS family permease
MILADLIFILGTVLGLV